MKATALQAIMYGAGDLRLEERRSAIWGPTMPT
jgi:hypothetical protein